MEKIKTKEIVGQIINGVDVNGFFEKKGADQESFRIEKEGIGLYKVIVFDSETDKNSIGKVYKLDLPGLEEYLTAMTTEPSSILNRL
jgi:hypothetical protein